MEIQQWTSHLEFLTLFITLLGVFYIFKQDIDKANERIDQANSQSNARIDQTNARLDQLYTMFIDLLKEKRKE